MSVKEQNEKQSESVEDTSYSGAVPKKVLDEMAPEIVTQYYLWDKVAKREIELYPWLLLPLIREVFGRSYPGGVEIRLTATEYMVRRIHKGNGSIYADIAVLVENRDIYYLGSQMRADEGPALQMLEYEIRMGLTYGIENSQEGAAEGAELEVWMPRSVILYLGNADYVEREKECVIRFADDTTHPYRIPVVRVQGYTLRMIEEKHLTMLLPFLPIRFRKYLGKKKDGTNRHAPEEVKKELTEFIRECVTIIEREKRNGELTEPAGKDIMEFLSITCRHLLKDEPELDIEVHKIMEPTILLTREKAAIEIKLIREQAEEEKQRILEEKEQAEKKLENSIRNFVERNQKSGQKRQQIKDDIQIVFSLEEAEAVEKMQKYWKSYPLL